MNLLAGVYDDAGRLDLAVPIYERVLEARREKLGEQHPDTLLSMSNLGIALEHSGQVGRAIPLFENAFEAQRTKRGEDHPDTLRTKNNLGAALLDAGLLDRAISLLGEALNALQTKRSAHHPDTLYTQRNLARAYEKAHRDQDAERLYRGVVEISARAKPRNDQFYSDSLAYLGRCLIHEHKNDEAVPVLRHCLEIKEKTQPGDWTTARARSLLGEALAGQKAYPEAEQLLLSARKELDEKRDKIRPIDRDETLHDAIDRLVRLYEASGKPAEAEMWRKKVAALPAASVGKPPAQPSADTRKSQPAKGPAPPPTTAPNGTKR